MSNPTGKQHQQLFKTGFAPQERTIQPLGAKALHDLSRLALHEIDLAQDKQLISGASLSCDPSQSTRASSNGMPQNFIRRSKTVPPFCMRRVMRRYRAAQHEKYQFDFTVQCGTKLSTRVRSFERARRDL
eukprot:4017949-Pleurochrysis_carterae.AAC.3